MALDPGTRLGPYEIVAPLGAGGMGEVYRARDTKLNREVALKVLPAGVTADPERLARFRREAQVLASLNHPHIAHVHGFEEAGGTQAIVMELVEGPTLADVIATGPMPLADVLPAARQIAEALEAAHEQGIIHRDLKPANIKVREDGTVKVLDFGLAKALDPVAEQSADLMNSPTITAHATQLGTILGTAAYMAPEQAKGRPVDRRADVWAFGVVLFEMLTGKRAFEGSDVSETLASVLAREPEWSALPPSTPAPIVDLLRQCLEKDRKERTPDIAVARFAIRDALTGAAARPVEQGAGGPLWQRPAFWAAVVVAVVAGGLGSWVAAPAPEAARVVRSSFELPGAPGNPTSRIVAISPPGTHVAFVVESQVWIRRLADLEPVLLTPNERDARTPTFSPDGQEVAFSDGERLKRVSISGGTPVDVAGPVPRRIPGLHWGDDGYLYVGTDEGIARVPASGGQLEVVVANTEEGKASSPFLLPGSDWLLFTWAATAEFDKAQVVAESLSTHERRVLVEGGYDARAVRSGHLLYYSGGTLFGRAFDRSRVATSGGPVSLVEHVGSATGTATSDTNYGVSDRGDLIYVFRVGQAEGLSLVSLDRQGQRTPLPAAPANYRSLRLSRDGTRIAAAIDETAENVDVWLIDVARAARQKLTFDGRSLSPVWSPDGAWIYYAARDADGAGASLWRRRSDLSGEAERVFASPDGRPEPVSVSGDGRRLGVQIGSRTGAGYRAAVLDLTEGASPQFLTADPNVDSRGPALSPDGRFVAYASEETGGAQVYVQEVASGRKRVVSVQVAVQPRWTADGKEIVFLNQGRNSYSTVRVIDADRLEFSSPALHPATAGPSASRYDISADGSRLVRAGLDVEDFGPGGNPEVRLVLNWFEELRAKIPMK